MPYCATVPAAAVVCFIVGYLFGLPALKLEGHYLALATFALALAVPQILKYKWLEGLTGGVQGIVLNKPEVPFGLPLTEDQWLYYYCLIVMIVLFWAANNILNSRSGRAMMAIRDYPIAADTMGIDTALYKTVTFGISAAYTGIAGALSASAIAFVAPDSFNIFLSIKFLIGLVVGGIGSLAGSVVGGIFYVLVDNSAQALSTFVKNDLGLPVRPVGLHRVRHPADRPDVPDADGHRRRRLHHVPSAPAPRPRHHARPLSDAARPRPAKATRSSFTDCFRRVRQVHGVISYREAEHEKDQQAYLRGRRIGRGSAYG